MHSGARCLLTGRAGGVIAGRGPAWPVAVARMMLLMLSQTAVLGLADFAAVAVVVDVAACCLAACCLAAVVAVAVAVAPAFRVQGSGFRVRGSKSRNQGLWCRVQDLELRVCLMLLLQLGNRRVSH